MKLPLKRRHPLLMNLGLFCLVSLLVFFGIQFFTKTGLFKIPGKVIYDSSLNADELATLETIFTKELVLDQDVRITATSTTTQPEPHTGSFTYQVLVPVTDFYGLETSISSATALSPDKSTKLIPINELSATDRLLAIDNQYYLDHFTTGAVFRTITFDSGAYTKEIEPLVKEQFTKTFPTRETVLTFAETGTTAFSRLLNRKLDAVGDPLFFSSQLKDFFANFDFVHTSNEASFSDYASSSGVTGTPICARPAFLNTLLNLHINVIELTGNHNRDCGFEAARATIDQYLAHDIKLVGGGKNVEEAKIPLQLVKQNNHITMLAYNQSTGGYTNDNNPGANKYSEEDAIANIAAAKARGDTVIVNIQYYECDAYASEYEDPICDRADSAAGDQVGFFRHLVDLGADIIVGTAAHQPQTFEQYGQGFIYYGLGNLFFDQYRWPGTTRSLVLAHYFYNNRLVQTKIIPTIYDANFQTRLLDPKTSRWFIERLLSARP